VKKLTSLILSAVLLLAALAACAGGTDPTPTAGDTPSPDPLPPITAAVGDIIEFGGYEWRVPDVSGGKALLLSEYILECRPYNEEYADVTWEVCTLRAYLNGEFYESFGICERERIVTVTNQNLDNQWSEAKGGNDTQDKIFLLSLSEVVKYFGDSGQLQNKPSSAIWFINDDFNEKRIAFHLDAGQNYIYNGKNLGAWWWLRSPGLESTGAALVREGIVFVDGYYVSQADGGLRPAFWVTVP
jgi:hypothetical protein